MFRRRLVLFIILIVTVSIGLFLWVNNQKLPLNTVRIDGQIFSVQEAKTPQQQVDGLAGVARLEHNQGMLFMLNGRPASFWMKGMIMNIDIIWIKDNKVVGIEHNVIAPAKDTPDSQLKSYASPVRDPQAVLEIAAGQAKAQHISIGDKVEISL